MDMSWNTTALVTHLTRIPLRLQEYGPDLPKDYSLWAKILTQDALSDLEARENFTMSTCGAYRCGAVRCEAVRCEAMG